MSDERRTSLESMLQWALDATVDPAMASADWIVSDIDGNRASAIAMLTDPAAPIEHLKQAKDAFKTMRIVGETAADRRTGARLYAAAIAAGLVWHGQRISRQSESAMERAFLSLVNDATVDEGLRHLAGRALAVLGWSVKHGR